MNGINVISESERKGHPRDLFWPWFAANISVLGSLPRGLPSFSIPWIPSADLVPVLIGGFAVSLVSFADTSVLSRAYAARLGQPVNPNQEMVGLGAANLAAGLFQGFPISSSSSRTPVAEAAGANAGRAVKVNVRVISATNRDLRTMVSASSSRAAPHARRQNSSSVGCGNFGAPPKPPLVTITSTS